MRQLKLTKKQLLCRAGIVAASTILFGGAGLVISTGGIIYHHCKYVHRDYVKRSEA